MNSINYNNLIISSFLILVSSALTFLAAHYWNRRAEVIRKADNLEKKKENIAFTLSQANDNLVSRVVELEKQLALVGAAITPISAAFQAILIKELTHFHTPEMDYLLSLVGPPFILTDTQQHDLSTALYKRAHDIDALIGDAERDAAIMLPMVMKRVRLEHQSATSYITLQVVKLPITLEN